MLTCLLSIFLAAAPFLGGDKQPIPQFLDETPATEQVQEEEQQEEIQPMNKAIVGSVINANSSEEPIPLPTPVPFSNS